MPTFEYKCPECKKTEETDSNDSKIYCDCTGAKVAMKRVYSFSGTVLKGSGWYSVDKRKTDGGTIG
jgi:putative FmdB family regulatory protein